MKNEDSIKKQNQTKKTDTEKVRSYCYKDFKEKALMDPEVKAEYDALQEEYDAIQRLIDNQVAVLFGELARGEASARKEGWISLDEAERDYRIKTSS